MTLRHRIARLGRFRSGCSPVGVDIGSTHVKLVQLAHDSGGEWRVVAAASFPRAAPGKPFDAAEAARLAGVIERQAFVGRAVVAGLPAAQLLTSTLELPLRAPGVPIEQIARMELARVHQLEPASFEFAQWEIPAPIRAAKATHVMAAACAHSLADPLLDVLEAQELSVRALDAEPCALTRACRALLAEGGATTALLDLGWSASRLAILYRGDIVYSRVIDQASLRSLYQNLQHELGLDERTITHLLAENYFAAGGAVTGSDGADSAGQDVRTILAGHFDVLVREINVALTYAVHRYPDSPLSRLLLVGGGAELPGVADHLGAILGVEACVVQPVALVRSNGLEGLADAQICGSPSMVGAVGLALWREHEQ